MSRILLWISRSDLAFIIAAPLSLAALFAVIFGIMLGVPWLIMNHLVDWFTPVGQRPSAWFILVWIVVLAGWLVTLIPLVSVGAKVIDKIKARKNR